jgi:sugar phosphate isomerase/epimerase
MKLGIFAKTFPRATLEETLDAVVSHGLTQVQFNMSCMGLATLPDRIDEGSCVWIAQQFRERGLTMAAISGTFNTCDPSDSRLENNLRRLDVLAAACRWLDTRIITLCTGTRDRDDMWKWHPENVRRSSWDDLVRAMKAAVKIADRHEVTLAFEPEVNNVVNSVMRARKLLDEVGSPWLKVAIDPANLVRRGEFGRMTEIFDETFEWLGADIVLAHAKEPQITEADEAVLKRLGGETSRKIVRSEVLTLKSVQPHLVDPVHIGDKFSITSGLLHEPTLAFYYKYFAWLNKINYVGAVVIHGLGENEVAPRTSFLRSILGSISLEV